MRVRARLQVRVVTLAQSHTIAKWAVEVSGALCERCLAFQCVPANRINPSSDRRTLASLAPKILKFEAPTADAEDAPSRPLAWAGAAAILTSPLAPCLGSDGSAGQGTRPADADVGF